MISMQSIWTWAKAKAGRIISSVGVLLSGVETFDITPIKDPLEGFIGHRGVMGVTVALFVGNYVRHQWVASKNPPKPSLPAPSPESVR